MLGALGVSDRSSSGTPTGGRRARIAAGYPHAVRGLVLVDAAAAGQDPGSRPAQSRLIQFLSWPVVQQLADVTFSQTAAHRRAKQGDAEAFDPG